MDNVKESLEIPIGQPFYLNKPWNGEYVTVRQESDGWNLCEGCVFDDEEKGECKGPKYLSCIKDVRYDGADVIYKRIKTEHQILHEIYEESKKYWEGHGHKASN